MSPGEGNGSGRGKGSAVPAEIDRWNWGAFLLSWVWGIGNNTLIALLAFVPCVNIAMPFVLGLHGSKWAWQNKRWDSIEQFKAAQRKWALAGVALIGFLVVAAGLAFFLATETLKTSEAYQLASRRLASDPQVTQVLGQPLSTGMVQGRIKASGPSGSADISFSVEGPKGEGKAYVDATKDMGAWVIERLEVEVQGRPQRLVIVPEQKAPAAGASEL